MQDTPVKLKEEHLTVFELLFTVKSWEGKAYSQLIQLCPIEGMAVDIFKSIFIQFAGD